MCGIFASFNRDTIKELFELNSYRGCHSFSIMQGGRVIRELGAFNYSLVDSKGYKVCHVQAPTTSARGIESVHPAQIGEALLWHNGIIKDFDVVRLQKELDSKCAWDTKLLLQALGNCDMEETLSQINGSFACIMRLHNQLYVFRNEISPLFFDDKLNISSVKFPNSRPVPPNKIFILDLDDLELIPVGAFQTLENPYFFNQ